MTEHENPTGDVRYAFIYEGPVTDRNDPLKLGRVRVFIPGLCEPSTGWAFPVGTANGGGGSAARGAKFVPPLGAEVAIFFKGGDPDQPRYIPGHWGIVDGASEMPVDSQTDANTGNTITAADSPDVHCHEFARYKITIDERAGTPGSFAITDKKSGDTITFDGSGPGILIKASAGIVFQCDGIFAVDASKITLNGRSVSDGPQSI